MNAALDTLRSLVPFTRYPYRGETRSCNLCGSDDSRLLCTHDRRLKRLDTVICMNCGLLRTDPMPTEEELGAYYRSQYRFEYQLARSGPPRFHVNRSRRLARQRAEFLAPVLVEGARVLDFGCGSGEFLEQCRRRGCEVLGIEPGADYAEYARRTHGVEVIARPWREADLGDRQFDVITSFHVFEHLRDPRQALEFLLDHLAPGGVIWLEVPNLAPPIGGRRLFEVLHFAHVHGFTPETLTLLGQSCGLKPDPRFEARGTSVVFRRRAAERPEPERLGDPAFAEQLARAYPEAGIFGFVLGGGWIVDALRRARKDIRDSRG